MEQQRPLNYLIPDFCRIYAISRASFYREVQADRLHFFKRGRRSVIAREEAERWDNMYKKRIQNTLNVENVNA